MRGALAADCTDYYTSRILIEVQLNKVVWDADLKRYIYQPIGKPLLDDDNDDKHALVVGMAIGLGRKRLTTGTYSLRYTVVATPTSKASVQAGTRPFSVKNSASTPASSSPSRSPARAAAGAGVMAATSTSQIG